MSDPVKGAADVAAATVTVATLANWLPSVAAIFTIVWTAIRIFEWWKKRKD